MLMRLRHKHKIILELDINCVEDESLKYLVRNFRADILNTVISLNTNSDIKRLDIEVSKDVLKTTLIATMLIKMTNRDFTRFLCTIYQKYPNDTLRIF